MMTPEVTRTGKIPGNEDLHWHSAPKGLRFLRACGG